jgi:hypothetical protein
VLGHSSSHRRSKASASSASDGSRASDGDADDDAIARLGIPPALAADVLRYAMSTTFVMCC